MRPVPAPRWMRGAFVILQIAVSLVLLVGAGLFLRTLENAYSVDLGYQVDQTLVAALNLESRGYFEGGPRGPEAGSAVYEQILSRVEALPGVVAAGAARMTVLSGGARSTAVSTDGRPIESGQQQCARRSRQRCQPPLLRNDEHSDSSRTVLQCVRRSQNAAGDHRHQVPRGPALATRGSDRETVARRKPAAAGRRRRSSRIRCTRPRSSASGRRPTICCWRRTTSRASRCTCAPRATRCRSCRRFAKPSGRPTASLRSSVRSCSAMCWIEP